MCGKLHLYSGTLDSLSVCVVRKPPFVNQSNVSPMVCLFPHMRCQNVSFLFVDCVLLHYQEKFSRTWYPAPAQGARSLHMVAVLRTMCRPSTMCGLRPHIFNNSHFYTRAKPSILHNYVFGLDAFHNWACWLCQMHAGHSKV